MLATQGKQDTKKGSTKSNEKKKSISQDNLGIA
jgi:hypothetical protein